MKTQGILEYEYECPKGLEIKHTQVELFRQFHFFCAEI